MLYRNSTATKTTLRVNKSYEGETIEQKVFRIVNNKEPIKDGAPLIYTERKDGINPGYDIRTDRWELATEAMDIVTKQRLAKRTGGTEKDLGTQAQEGMKKESNSGAESVNATGGDTPK